MTGETPTPEDVPTEFIAGYLDEMGETWAADRIRKLESELKSSEVKRKQAWDIANARLERIDELETELETRKVFHVDARELTELRAERDDLRAERDDLRARIDSAPQPALDEYTESWENPEKWSFADPEYAKWYYQSGKTPTDVEPLKDD